MPEFIPKTGVTHLRVLALEDALLFLFLLGVPDQLQKESRLPSLTWPLQEDPFLVALLAGSLSCRFTGAPLKPHQATPVTSKLAGSVPGPDTETEAAPRPATKPILFLQATAGGGTPTRPSSSPSAFQTWWLRNEMAGMGSHPIEGWEGRAFSPLPIRHGCSFQPEDQSLAFCP